MLYKFTIRYNLLGHKPKTYDELKTFQNTSNWNNKKFSSIREFFNFATENEGLCFRGLPIKNIKSAKSFKSDDITRFSRFNYIILDFDDIEGETAYEFAERVGLNCYYESWSSTAEKPKIRGFVFFNNDIKFVGDNYKHLHEYYESLGADAQTKDFARLYFDGLPGKWVLVNDEPQEYKGDLVESISKQNQSKRALISSKDYQNAEIPTKVIELSESQYARLQYFIHRQGWDNEKNYSHTNLMYIYNFLRFYKLKGEEETIADKFYRFYMSTQRFADARTPDTPKSLYWASFKGVLVGNVFVQPQDLFPFFGETVSIEKAQRICRNSLGSLENGFSTITKVSAGVGKTTIIRQYIDEGNAAYLDKPLIIVCKDLKLIADYKNQLKKSNTIHFPNLAEPTPLERKLEKKGIFKSRYKYCYNKKHVYFITQAHYFLSDNVDAYYVFDEEPQKECVTKIWCSKKDAQEYLTKYSKEEIDFDELPDGIFTYDANTFKEVNGHLERHIPFELPEYYAVFSATYDFLKPDKVARVKDKGNYNFIPVKLTKGALKLEEEHYLEGAKTPILDYIYKVVNINKNKKIVLYTSKFFQDTLLNYLTDKGLDVEIYDRNIKPSKPIVISYLYGYDKGVNDFEDFDALITCAEPRNGADYNGSKLKKTIGTSIDGYIPKSDGVELRMRNQIEQVAARLRTVRRNANIYVMGSLECVMPVEDYNIINI